MSQGKDAYKGRGLPVVKVFPIESVSWVETCPSVCALLKNVMGWGWCRIGWCGIECGNGANFSMGLCVSSLFFLGIPIRASDARIGAFLDPVQPSLPSDLSSPCRRCGGMILG